MPGASAIAFGFWTCILLNLASQYWVAKAQAETNNLTSLMGAQILRPAVPNVQLDMETATHVIGGKERTGRALRISLPETVQTSVVPGAQPAQQPLLPLEQTE